MCGIAGYFNPDQPPEEGRRLLKRMCDTLIARGPDDEGYLTEGAVGLGVRRLSIVDLAGGHQPIGNESGSCWVVLNGEIYNFKELRAELQSRGVRFRTGTDTEVVLRLYEAEGIACLARLNGMFAFALWDAQAGRLLLARDRLGVKPLHYAWDGRTLLFASELKALLAGGVPQKADETAIWDYLTFRYVPQPKTIWQGVQKLMPGHLLILDARKQSLGCSRYWDIPYNGASAWSRSWRQYEEEFESLFTDAVRLRLRADVPVGVLLSGGLDSSSVAAAACAAQQPMVSYTVACAGSPQSDERRFARMAAQALGTDHQEVVVTQQQCIDFLPEMVRIADEPLADPTAIPLYFVTRAARSRVKVLLSGEGADEVLGGYHWHWLQRNWEALHWFQKLPRRLRYDALYPLAGRIHPHLAARVAWANTPLQRWGIERPLAMTNYASEAEKRSWWKTEAAVEDSLMPLRRAVARTQIARPLDQAMYVACQEWLADDLLAKADRMSMANSLELRTPFLDFRLVEWAARAPQALKVGRSGLRYQTKRILRRFAQRRLPRAIVQRPKQGFPVPIYDWLGGPLRPSVERFLHPGRAQVGRWLTDAMIAQTVACGTAAASRTDQARLWNLLVLELWCRQWNPQ